MSPDPAALLTSRQTEDRIRAVNRIARSEREDKQELLLKALADKSHYVAALAAEALGDCADDSACSAMTDRFEHLSADGLKRDPGCHIRAKLAFALGKLEYLPASDALRVGIRTSQIEAVGGVPFDTGAHLRANCALALAQMRARDSLRDIAILLFDNGHAVWGSRARIPPTPEPRKAAAQAIGRLGDPAGTVPLAVRLAYPEGESLDVLQECMHALVQLQDPRALETLEPYLQHEDELLAAYAALMLATLQLDEAPAMICETIERLSGDALEAAVIALTVHRSDAARDALQKLSQHTRSAVRIAACQALASLKDERDPEAEPST